MTKCLRISFEIVEESFSILAAISLNEKPCAIHILFHESIFFFKNNKTAILGKKRATA